MFPKLLSGQRSLSLEKTCKQNLSLSRLVVGCDEGVLHIYNYSTSERVREVQAHTDYIRNLIVHPTLPYVLSCSDDGFIKMWDFD